MAVTQSLGEACSAHSCRSVFALLTFQFPSPRAHQAIPAKQQNTLRICLKTQPVMKFLSTCRLVLGACVASVTALTSVNAELTICNAWQSPTYDAARIKYPELTVALDTVQQQGTVPWYTDNSNWEDLDYILSVLSQCGPDTKIPLVIYGIPNKDCEAGFSNNGFNKNMADYQNFISRLATTFPTQNMIYIVEPDAVGLTANGGCAVSNGYPTYLQHAIQALSANPNAELYLDIGYWTLLPSGNPKGLAEVVNSIWPASRSGLKGIVLNTSNYQYTSAMMELCESFSKITGKSDMKCVIDTSRNFVGPTANSEWCNARDRGMGVPPTVNTGIDRAAYFLWVKPPGESDGTCVGQSSSSMVGPPAGAFFKEHFVMLWENGYFMAPPSPTMTPSPTPTPTPSSSSSCSKLPYDSCGSSSTGATCCPAGTTCHAWSEYYYQCVPTLALY